MAECDNRRKPRVCECGDHAWAAVTKGYVTLVSPGRSFLLCEKWHALVTPYKGLVYARRGGGKQDGVYLHREISGIEGEEADHRNGNGLDNRDSNLRPATRSQNSQNMRGYGRSGIRGVSFHASTGKWRAQIRVGGKNLHLGRFTSMQEAEAAYRAAAAKHHGEFGRL